MKLCFLVDARSAIALNWIRYFIAQGHDVHVISSHLCNPDTLEGAKVYQVPIAFGGIGGYTRTAFVASTLRRLDRYTKGTLRSWFTPIDLLPHLRRVRRLCNSIAPDLVHAMRIPYEGIMAALAVRGKPLLISCWGNDFTLFTASASDRLLIRMAMRRADALHCDCKKDARLAGKWEFSPKKPTIVLPGAGGVDMSVFHPGQFTLKSYVLPKGARVIINPRGVRMYVRNDSFFNAIPIVLKDEPKALFLCTGLQGEPFAEKAVRDLGIEKHVRLLPTVSRDELAELFRLAEVSASPSTHDGTPNTLLEAMASGCLPVAGDIESIREWIEHGANGLLCDPASPAALAAEMIRGLRDGELRRRAIPHNIRLVQERADYKNVMATADLFYRQMLGLQHEHSEARASRG
jgi:glycosyltransferase involved in cell wall biosynthesis